MSEHPRAAPDLDDVADELYGLAPNRFVEVRAERAGQAKAAGDKVLAKEITGLRRPTAAAWAVNLLVRGRAEQVQGLLDLGAALRSAQEGLEGEELRRLTVQRRQVVAALARQARADAHAAGAPISADGQEEVAATLLAALADPAAGDAVRSGRLTRSLEYSGVGPVDPDTVAAATVPRRAPGRPAAQGSPSPAPAATRGSAVAPPDELAAARAAQRAAAERARLREAARERLAAARREAALLDRRVTEMTAAAHAAQAAQEQALEQVETLEAALAQARETVEAARRTAAEADRERRAAARHAEAGRQAVERAGRELDRL